MIRFVLEAVGAFVFRLGPIPVWVILCFVVGRLFIYGVDRISQSIESLKPEVVTVEKEKIVYREHLKKEAVMEITCDGAVCESGTNNILTTIADNADQGGVTGVAFSSMDVTWSGGGYDRPRRHGRPMLVSGDSAMTGWYEN